MSMIVVDVESDGPVPPIHSMVCFGAIVVDQKLDKTFFGRTRPISDKYLEPALAISGYSREEHLKFDDPLEVMAEFKAWVLEHSQGRPVFFSDNVAYDWQWINYYFHAFTGGNPFGWSGRRIGDVFAGAERNLRTSWKHLRKTRHTHNPVDDARGNAEALLEIIRKYDIRGT